MRTRSCLTLLVSALVVFALLAGSGARATGGEAPLNGGRGNNHAEKEEEGLDVNIIFLHHSTGNQIWKHGVPEWFAEYNSEKGANLTIIERSFPKQSPYGWNNYPYDYWNIWVKNAGDTPYLEESTLEILTREYDVIVFKHCFPVSEIQEDTGSPDVGSNVRRIENYKLQYAALKEKMHQYPDNIFVVWTGAAQVDYANWLHKLVSLIKGRSSIVESAKRAKEFFDWVRNEWDEPGDNIYLWDFYELETEGGLYLKKEYAEGGTDSHPNESFSRMAAPLFCRRLVDIIEGRGDSGDITGKDRD